MTAPYNKVAAVVIVCAVSWPYAWIALHFVMKLW